jgi:hypothetical protein
VRFVALDHPATGVADLPEPARGIAALVRHVIGHGDILPGEVVSSALLRATSCAKMARHVSIAEGVKG